MRSPIRLVTPLIALALLLACGPMTAAGQDHLPEASKATPATPATAGTWQVTDQPALGDARIVALSPDGSAVAYSLDAFRLAAESDIHLFELAAGESVNLTEDGLDGGLLDLEASTVPVDVLPAWSTDSQSLTFARTDLAEGQRATDLMTIARGGGEPEPRHVVSRDELFAIHTPMHSLADGSLLYAFSPPDIDAPEAGLWLLDAAGEARQILAGPAESSYPMPAIADVAEKAEGTVIAGYSQLAMGQVGASAPIAFLLDLDSGQTEPLLHPEDENVLLGPAGFAPDGSTLIASSLNADADEVLVVVAGEAAQVMSLGPSPEGVAGAAITFVPPCSCTPPLG